MTENIKDFLNEIDELKEYRNLVTIEEIQKMKKEEDILKFYYCESEDEYYIGKRVDTMYYAKYSKTGFVWCMSMYLPWGKHVIAPNTLWKEHTYPSEPKEIPFFEWLQGFIKKECLGTVEECRRAMEKQKAKKVINDTAFGICPNCHNEFNSELINEYNMKYCIYCGQAIDLRLTYKPKIIEGKISGTGWPIDGCTLILALWDWDNYGSWYLHDWKPEDDQAMMETMFIAETEAGMCLYDTLKEFADHWEEWESEGSFCIPLKNVEVIKVLQEEQKEIK